MNGKISSNPVSSFESKSWTKSINTLTKTLFYKSSLRQYSTFFTHTITAFSEAMLSKSLKIWIEFGYFNKGKWTVLYIENSLNQLMTKTFSVLWKINNIQHTHIPFPIILKLVLLLKQIFFFFVLGYSQLFNILVTWCKQPTHWKSPWCWKGLSAEVEEGVRGWDGWMASLMQWTWTWSNFGRWWGTGRPGTLQSVGSQRVRHNNNIAN